MTGSEPPTSGAVGVVVTSNAPGGGPIAMGCGGTCPVQAIPSVGISWEDGLVLKGLLANGPVTGAVEDPPGTGIQIDGDFDIARQSKQPVEVFFAELDGENAAVEHVLPEDPGKAFGDDDVDIVDLEGPDGMFP